MLCYANASLPTRKREWCSERTMTVQRDLQRRLTRDYHSTYLRKKYIRNHRNMLGGDNRGSDRAKDCHLNNGMPDKASLSRSLKENVTQWHKLACNHLFNASNYQQEASLWLESSRNCFLSTTNRWTTPIS